MNIQRWSRAAALSVLTLWACAGCQPGYMKASDLESRGQGPSACARSCEDIGMRMGALVLVGNDLPGCVCQPLTVQGAAPPVPAPPPVTAPAPTVVPPTTPAPTPTPTPEVAPSAPSPTSSVEGSNGAAAATTGYVVLAAAAVARQARQERQRQEAQQRNY